MDYFSSSTTTSANPSSSYAPPSSVVPISKSKEHNSKKKGGKKSNNNNGVRLSTDPQSVAARERRHRISDRFKILQSLVPGGTKMDTVTMLEEAINYVKFLKTQILLHQTLMNFAVDDDPSLYCLPGSLPDHPQQPTSSPYFDANNFVPHPVQQQQPISLGFPDSFVQGGQEPVNYDPFMNN